MKGIIFNLLEKVVTKYHGEAAWDQLLEETRLGGAYTSLGSYADDDIEKLVSGAGKMLSMSRNETLRWFGHESMSFLAQYYPSFFSPHAGTRSFVRSVNSIIHPEVRKLYAGADCPFFHFSEGADGALVMTYDSARKLCALAQGFIEGAGDYFRETVEVEHLSCMHRGDSTCQLSIRTESPNIAHAAE